MIKIAETNHLLEIIKIIKNQFHARKVLNYDDIIKASNSSRGSVYKAFQLLLNDRIIKEYQESSTKFKVYSLIDTDSNLAIEYLNQIRIEKNNKNPFKNHVNNFTRTEKHQVLQQNLSLKKSI